MATEVAAGIAAPAEQGPAPCMETPCIAAADTEHWEPVPAATAAQSWRKLVPADTAVEDIEAVDTAVPQDWKPVFAAMVVVDWSYCPPSCWLVEIGIQCPQHCPV